MIGSSCEEDLFNGPRLPTPFHRYDIYRSLGDENPNKTFCRSCYPLS